MIFSSYFPFQISGKFRKPRNVGTFLQHRADVNPSVFIYITHTTNYKEGTMLMPYLFQVLRQKVLLSQWEIPCHTAG